MDGGTFLSALGLFSRMPTCPTCGVVFESERAGHGWKKYCSNKCLGIANGNRLRNKPRSIEAIRKLRETVRSRYQPHFDLSPEQLGYIAGLLDAEGTIQHLARGARNFFTTRLAIVNTDRVVLDRMCSWLGFGVVDKRCFRESDKHFGAKQVYVWRNSVSEFSLTLLNLLLPYLRVKYDKATGILGTAKEKAPMDWSYVAAFYDGEGSASLIHDKRHNGMCYHIVISNNYRPVLEEISSFMTFGKIYAHDNGFVLQVARHDDQLKFAQAVLPFSIIKHEGLARMVQFIQNRDWNMDSRGGHKLAHVSDDELRRKYLEEKKSIRRLAAEYNVKYNPMREHLLKHGIPLRSSKEGTQLKHAAIYDFPKESMISRYNGGESACRLAKEFGMDHHTFCKWLRENGVKVRPKLWKLHDVPSEELLGRYHDGWSVRALAEQYKVSVPAMYQCLRKLGVVFSFEQPTEGLVRVIER